MIWGYRNHISLAQKTGTIHRNTLTVLTVTLKGVAAVDVASMVGGFLSEELPGMLRRRPDLSGGDSANRHRNVSQLKDQFQFVDNLLNPPIAFLPRVT